MEYIALHYVRIGGRLYSAGECIPAIEDEGVAKRLTERGAIREAEALPPPAKAQTAAPEAEPAPEEPAAPEAEGPEEPAISKEIEVEVVKPKKGAKKK